MLQLISKLAFTILSSICMPFFFLLYKNSTTKFASYILYALLQVCSKVQFQEFTIICITRQLSSFYVQSSYAQSSFLCSRVFGNNLVFFDNSFVRGNSKKRFARLPGRPVSVSVKDSTLDVLLGNFWGSHYFGTKMNGCFR